MRLKTLRRYLKRRGRQKKLEIGLAIALTLAAAISVAAAFAHIPETAQRVTQEENEHPAAQANTADTTNTGGKQIVPQPILVSGEKHP